MASRTRNLKLIVEDNLSASARSNLMALDALGAVFQLDNTDDAVIRSTEDIVLRPHDNSIGGDGIGGTVTAGDANQPLTSFIVWADEVSFSKNVGLEDQGTSGTRKLILEYDSTLSGAVDTASDRTLSIDLNGANRTLVLGGSFSLLTSSLSLTAPIPTAWTLPATPATAGQVLSNDGADVLSWVTVSGSGSSIRTLSEDWITVDGTTKTVTHNWGSRKIIAQVLDSSDNYANVEVDITRPTDNTVVLVASEAPSSSWLVLLTEIV